MLDLQARIHFKEVEVFIAIDDKFHRAGGAIIHRFGQRDRLLAHRLSGLGIKKRARRFFNDLLVTPLNGTFALAQINHIAVLIAENLNLNMARLGNEFFDKNAVIAKAGRRLIFR